MNSPVTPIRLGPYTVGGANPLLIIAGPCVIESRDFTLKLADELHRTCERLNVPLVFKASFDKANRTSGKAFRGVGLEAGLKILADASANTGRPVTTDVHEPGQAKTVAEVCEVLQIPAFLARQTDLLVAAAATGRVVNVKKGQFMAPWDMKNVVAKLKASGTDRAMLTERGTTFGYGMLVNDMRSVPWMQSTGSPVIFDATHSVQTPGALGDRTGGDRTMVPPLARAAVAAGCDGLFLETHPDPDSAPSDGPNMLRLEDFGPLVEVCLKLRAALS